LRREGIKDLNSKTGKKHNKFREEEEGEGS